MSHTEDPERRYVLTHNAYDVQNVRSMEQPLLDKGIPLMRMAASAAASVAEDMLADAALELEDAQVVLLAGAGDNGGDGLYAAAKLAQDGAFVTAIAVGKTLHDSAFSTFMQAGGKVLVLDTQSQIPNCASGFSAGEAGERLHTAIALASHADLILDAMTGIGVTGALRGIAATLTSSLGCDAELPERPAMSGSGLDDAGDNPMVLAIDTPSGIGVDDGSLPGSYIPADMTVMFGAMKPCAMLPPASYICGTTTLVDFGFDFDGKKACVEAVDKALARQSIRLPQLDDAKYSRGVVGLVTGSAHFPGAAVLSSHAAARTNTGMIRYMGPARAQDMVLHALPETTIGKGRVQSWVVGSGVPTEESAESDLDVQRTTISALLAHYAIPNIAIPDMTISDMDNTDTIIDMTRANTEIIDDPARFDRSDELSNELLTQSDDDTSDTQATLEAYDMPALYVDAGALDLLPSRVPPQVVLTPHAGELAQLLRSRGEDIDASDVQAEPWHWAQRTHEITGATVLLKGAVTIVVGDDGDGDDNDDNHTRTLVSGSGPAWLATAGSGDVLAGITGGLLAQQDDMLQEDASLSVEVAASAAYLHGLAASIASNSDQSGWKPPTVFGTKMPSSDETLGHPIIAGDVIDSIPMALQEILE